MTTCPSSSFIAYVLACLVITVIPGPTVTLIVANSLTHGARAGLLNVLGTQFGLGLMMLILAVGLSSIIATMGIWFDWLRLVGAAYLIWLGWKLLRSSGGIEAQAGAAAPRGGFVLQGLPGAARQSEGAALVRRVHSAVRRSVDATMCGRSSCWA